MRAIVIHPDFSFLGGGEYICLNVIAALEEIGYRVTLLSENFDSVRVKRAFQFEGKVEVDGFERLKRFGPIVPKALSLQKAFFIKQQRKRTLRLSGKFDLVFHTQTPDLLGHLDNKTFNLFYNRSYLFSGTSKSWKKPYYAFLHSISGNEEAVREACNIPLSKSLESYLGRIGYSHTKCLFPPCDMRFHPRAKTAGVVQVARTVPPKRLEEFMEIAELLPQYDFVIVGSLTEAEKNFYPGYADRLLKQAPENVRYIDARIRNVPWLLETAKVYLYTSHEPGINISTAEAVRAGCIPVTPTIGGGAEIVSELGAGYTYSSPIRAASYVQEAIESPRWSPEELSQKAKVFSEESFQSGIAGIVQRVHSRVNGS